MKITRRTFMLGAGVASIAPLMAKVPTAPALASEGNASSGGDDACGSVAGVLQIHGWERCTGGDSASISVSSGWRTAWR